jgi:hypothetical protein
MQRVDFGEVVYPDRVRPSFDLAAST